MNELLLLMKHELAITAIIFILLFIKIGGWITGQKMLLLIQVLLLLNTAIGFMWVQEGSLFGGLYKTSLLTVYQKNILNLGVLLIAFLFTPWFKQCVNMAEFFVLLLSALLGLFFLLSSTNLLMFYLSLELASIPVAAMVSFQLPGKASAEAGVKMILSAAFASGILLFGISLVYGATGTIAFDELAALTNTSNLQVLAFVFLFAAFGFKLSIVPFHLWTADVYQGAPVATAAFLSVISKGAFAFVFITILYKVFLPLQAVWYPLLLALSIITMLVGNLFALRQQNMQRFLAFSSIAQVGFILAAISSNSVAGASAVLYFVLVYVFSNLAAFAVAGMVLAHTGRKDIGDYKGLYQSNPFLSWMLALALFSLAGVPPAAGFFAKLFLITAGAQKASYWYVIIIALNLVLSLYYYLRIVRAVFMDKAQEPMAAIPIPVQVKIGLIVCTIGIMMTGLLGQVYDYIVAIS
ncbi:MAG: hypothetical protein RL172_2497 [Bacteroidota bacterium]|jgi:NADH-quinone oxidoreductase subunit N